MTVKRFRLVAPSRRQLLRRGLLLGLGLTGARAIAAPASAAGIAAREDMKEEENQVMPEIMHLIKIRATQDKVYQTVATAEGIRNWWTRDAALDPKIGGAGEFGFYGHRFVIKVKVAELNPPAHVAWDEVSSTGGGFDGTSISFDLKSDGGMTSVLFAHRGFKTGGDNIAAATTRWGFYLFSLKRYLETGKGAPNPEDTDLIR
jgi:uncharacterized protein YndB with AHSA1/START domain